MTATLAGAAIADDVANTHRVVRRRLMRPLATQNVVAIAGDPDAERTLVVMAHHDAAPTGLIFDDRVQAWLAHEFPGVIERIDTSLPLWWLVLAGPAAVAIGAAPAITHRPGHRDRDRDRCADGQHRDQPDGARRQRQPQRSSRSWWRWRNVCVRSRFMTYA